MKTMRNLMLIIAATAALTACGNDGGVVTDVDMGASADAGNHDGSTPTDMGSPTDMGVPVDGNVPTDGSTDASVEVDGDVLDGGEVVDGDVDADVDGGAGPIAIEDVADSYVAAYCHLLFSCSTESIGEAAFVLAFASDEATCRSRLGRLLLGDSGPDSLPAQIRGVSEGTLTFDGDAARDCLGSLDCTVFDGSPASGACDHVFNGTVAAGDSCNSDLECAGDDVSCISASHTCPGTCGPAIAIGEECQRDSQCAADPGGAQVRCTSDDGPSLCMRVLYETVALGADCSASFADNTITNHVCMEGTFCDTSGVTPMCAAISESGGSCVDFGACPRGEFCNDGTCGPVTGIATTVGADCSESLCNPFLDLGCDEETSMCIALGDGSVGTACMTSGFTLPCNPGLYCDEGTGLCATRKVDGSSCLSGDECVTDFCAPSITVGGPTDAGEPTMVCQANCTL